ncbi:MAG: tetratricopeptide repeat protein [Methanotrichaceae archaeon]|jgi:tetratricopeptide (TPR) repeat protein
MAFALISLASAQVGTRDDPIPIGTTVSLGDGWQITVMSVIPDATNIVLKENMFNKPPKPGDQFFIARVQVKYTGTNSAQFGGDYRLRAVGPSNVGYSTFQNSPGVIPDPLLNSDVFTDGAIEGNVGWEIKSTDANALVMYDNPLSFGGNNEREYMALYTAPSTSPQDATTWINKGNALMDQKKYDAAIKAYDEATKLSPNNTKASTIKWAWDFKGLALCSQGKYDEAIKAYDEAIRLDPNWAGAWYDKGGALYNLKRYNESIESYDQAIKLNSSEPNYWFYRGNALGAQGKYDEAVKAYDKAIELKPDLKGLILNNEAITFVNEGGDLYSQGKYDEAVKAFDKGLEINQSYKEAWVYKGLALSNQGKYNESIKSIDKAIEINQSFEEAWYAKGIALALQGKYNDSLQAINEAIELKPDYIVAWNLNGLILKKLGKTSEADAAFAKAKELGYRG